MSRRIIVYMVVCLVLCSLALGGCFRRQAAPPQDLPTESRHFVLDSAVVAAGSDLSVQWRGMPGQGNGRDWITLVPSETEADSWGPYTYTIEPEGVFSVSGDEISEAGTYELRAYYDYPDGGFEIQDTLVIHVR